MLKSQWRTGRDDLGDVLAIRRQVFQEEQGFPAEWDADGLDTQCLHVLLSEEDQWVATARLWGKGGHWMISRVAVLPQARGKRIGDLMVRLVLFKALELGADTVQVNAQLTAQGFYEKLGFLPVEEPKGQCGKRMVLMEVTQERMPFGHCH